MQSNEFVVGQRVALYDWLDLIGVVTWICTDTMLPAAYVRWETCGSRAGTMQRVYFSDLVRA